VAKPPSPPVTPGGDDISAFRERARSHGKKQARQKTANFAARNKRLSEQEKALKKYGVPIAKTYSKPSNKTRAIRNGWKKIGSYVSNISKTPESTDHGFVFRPLTKAQISKLKKSGAVSGRQVTPKGAFISKPKGVRRKDFKATISKLGNLRVQYKGRTEKHFELSAELFALSPIQAVREVRASAFAYGKKIKKRLVQITLVQNGFDSGSIFSVSTYDDRQDFMKETRVFQRYMADDPAENLFERFKPTSGWEDRKAEDFVRTFSAKAIYT
jgi:hypothetical protein